MPAEIIPFPARKNSDSQNTDSRPEPENRVRLRAALDRLNSANRRQQEAVAAWRQALSELRLSMQSLDNSMQRYSLRLASLRAGVDGVHEQAIKLEQRAAAQTSVSAPPPLRTPSR